ncbi:iron complex transport system permease protein [Alkalibacterium subtropicum]|uniref:Iron complex transport system permease protein n=1 Tax=Alkalibacterium subtropicum TaxID=753702 RepID=A0A1I1ISJ4_9LACT|nr:iron complex transport system permease protein [Alkalibacterium subtropicum]
MNRISRQRQLFYMSILLLTFLIILSVGIGVTVGQVSIPLSESFQILANKLSGGLIGDLDTLSSNAYTNIIWQIRFPRVLLAMLTGMGLAMAGAVMQTTVQNPLADPYILGISSGASLGATFAIMIGFGGTSILAQMGLSFWAFLGAITAAFLVLLLSNVGGQVNSIKLVLSGMVLNALFTAFSNFIIYIANDAEGIRSVTFWMMGSLAGASWSILPLIATVVIAGFLFFVTQERILNIMLLGDEAAITLGVNLAFYRKLYLVVASILTGIIVANSGMIGFVGLIIPHIVRGIVGSNHRYFLTLSIFSGSLFMVWSDILSRIILPTVELPIGILTSLIGAPLFIYIFVKKGYEFGG